MSVDLTTFRGRRKAWRAWKRRIDAAHGIGRLSVSPLDEAFNSWTELVDTSPASARVVVRAPARFDRVVLFVGRVSLAEGSE